MHLTLIGDIHGCYHSLLALLEQLADLKDNRIILMGDLINKGPHSFEVVEWAKSAQIEFLLGNHEYLCMHRNDPHFKATWQRSGSHDTIRSIKKQGFFHYEGVLAEMSLFFSKHGMYSLTVPTAYRKTLVLTHAGINPQLNERFNAWEDALHFDYASPHSILFNKSPLAPLNDCIQVIGHQPKAYYGPLKEDRNYYLDSGCVYTDKEGMGYLSALSFDLLEEKPPLIFRQKNKD